KNFSLDIIIYYVLLSIKFAISVGIILNVSLKIYFQYLTDGTDGADGTDTNQKSSIRQYFLYCLFIIYMLLNSPYSFINLDVSITIVCIYIQIGICTMVNSHSNPKISEELDSKIAMYSPLVILIYYLVSIPLMIFVHLRATVTYVLAFNITILTINYTLYFRLKETDRNYKNICIIIFILSIVDNIVFWFNFTDGQQLSNQTLNMGSLIIQICIELAMNILQLLTLDKNNPG